MNTDIPVPPPPPDAGKIPVWAGEGLAKGEERNWTDEKALQGQKNKNNLWALKAIGLVTVLLIWFFVLVFVLSLSSWLAHYILPDCWHWLNAEQLSKIQSVIFSGAIGAVVSSYVQKHISN